VENSAVKVRRKDGTVLNFRQAGIFWDLSGDKVAPLDAQKYWNETGY